MLAIVLMLAEAFVAIAPAWPPPRASISAAVMASPIEMRMVAAPPKPRVGHRFTVMSFTRNVGNTDLQQPTATVSFDVLGLHLVEHRVARDAWIPGGGLRVDRWVLEAIHPGAYVIGTSMQAVLGDLLVNGSAPAVVVTVRQ